MRTLAANTAHADYLLALAQGFTGMLAIAVAILAYLGERTVRRHRAKDPVYQRNLGLIMFVAAATVLLALVSWSTWCAVAPRHVTLLLGVDSRSWLAAVFGLLSTAAFTCGAGAALLLTRFRKQAQGASNWKP